MDELKEQVALVTGSSRGIGAAIAKLFAQHGAHVALHGRDARALAGVESDIVRSGWRAITVHGDVTSLAEIDAVRAEVESRLGPVDILVANAGGSLAAPGPLEAMDEHSWRAAIDGNLTATFLTLKSFLPGMKQRRSGTIITISSAAARRPHPESPIAYAVAKAGIVMLTQDAAMQAGPYNVRVNCIAPETILTEGNLQRIPGKIREKLVAMHPLRRLGTPEDVARAALFLASPQSDWITGIVVDVAGGAVMVG